MITHASFLLRMPISIYSEGIPFLVITVGLDKPYLLAKAILGARERSIDPQRQHSHNKSSIPLSVRRKVLLGVDVAGP